MINLLPDAALSLSEEQRRKIACTLVMVAASDGALVREEISAIESAMGAMMLHPESREEVRQLLTQPPELDSLLEGMETAAIRLALRDAALLASVDGDYEDIDSDSVEYMTDDFSEDEVRVCKNPVIAERRRVLKAGIIDKIKTLAARRK